jgi:hypothetical protein
MPDSGALADRDIVIDKGRLVHEICRRWPNVSGWRHRDFRLQGVLTALQHRQDPQVFRTIGTWEITRPNTFQKMQAFRPYRLTRVDRDGSSFGATGDRDMVFPIDLVWVELELVVWFHIVEDRHLLIPDDHQFLLLEGVQPRHENMGVHPAGKR